MMRRRHWIFFAFFSAFAFVTWQASGQSQNTGLTGINKASDVVQARQTVMDGIETEMHDIDQASSGAEIPLGALQAHADRISTLLMAFPHLFPPQTQPSPDAAIPTSASPAIWQEFEDFYARASEASQTAYDASQVASLEDFRSAGTKLRAVCDGCHAKYMQVNQPRPNP